MGESANFSFLGPRNQGYFSFLGARCEAGSGLDPEGLKTGGGGGFDSRRHVSSAISREGESMRGGF